MLSQGTARMTTMTTSTMTMGMGTGLLPVALARDMVRS
jgi:hypothetical protein